MHHYLWIVLSGKKEKKLQPDLIKPPKYQYINFIQNTEYIYSTSWIALAKYGYGTKQQDSISNIIEHSQDIANWIKQCCWYLSSALEIKLWRRKKAHPSEYKKEVEILAK